MTRKVICIFTILIFCFTLSGCTDASEVDDNIYPLVIGLDKGVNNVLLFTIQYPTYASKSPIPETSPNSLGSSNLHSIEAPSILGGINMLNMAISRSISLSHTKELVISEELARSGVGDYLAPLARYRETRRSMFVVVTKGKAIDFIRENKANIGESLSKSIELMISQANNTAFFPNVTFQDFYKAMMSSYSQAFAAYAGVNNFGSLNTDNENKLPHLKAEPALKPGGLPRSGVAKREFVGTAVFDGAKMVGSLDPYETRYLEIITGKFKRGIFTINDEADSAKAITLDLRLGRKPKIKGYFKNNLPYIDIYLDLEADIGSIQSRINYENITLIDNLSEQIKVNLKEGIIKTIEKTQKDLNADVFSFGTSFAGYFSTIQKWEEYNWLKHYQDAVVNVNLKINIRRTGALVQSSPIFNSHGKK